MTHVRRARARLWLVAAVVAGAMAFSAAGAWAAPAEPTMNLTDLQSALDADPDGIIEGYMKTVVKGEAIVEIDVDILAITGGSGENSSLILFESSDPLIDKYGGIVAGMSGSPIFIGDKNAPAEDDPMIGALSYGNWFTLGGTGLATPIEYMTAIEETYEIFGVQELDAPMLLNGSVVDKIIVAPNPDDFSGSAAEGALVADPLNSVMIGGIQPGTKAYTEFTKKAEAGGMRVMPIAAKLGGEAMKGGQPFETTLTAGAAVASLASRGDLWYGGVGTVTYENDGKVLAFGHPMWWDGKTSRYMSNAWIDGVWPSQETPYKLSRPGAVRGEFQQDRNAGNMGVIDVSPAETTITASATLGERSKETTTFATRAIMNDPFDGPFVGALGAYVAGERLYDSWLAPGSVTTTSTIVVGAKGDPEEYTVTLRNVWDDSYDIRFSAVYDIMFALMRIQDVTYEGLETPEIKSVDLQAAFSEDRIEARVVDVETPNGLKTGDNLVRVSLLAYGVEATQTIETTLTIPSDVPLTGTLVVGETADDEGAGEGEGEEPTEEPVTDTTRATVASVVDELNEQVSNDILSVKFFPEDMSAEDFEGDAEAVDEGPVVYDAISTTVDTPWYITGGVAKLAGQVTAAADPSTIAYGGYTYIYGKVVGAEKGTVSIYGTPVGGTEVLLATATLESVGPFAVYETELSGLKKTTNIRVRFDGDSTMLAAEATTRVKVNAKITLSSTATRITSGKYVTLKSVTYPVETAGGTVTFERFDAMRRRWVKITSKTLVAGTGSASASYKWRPPVGTNKVRARFGGTASNTASTSKTVTIYVR